MKKEFFEPEVEVLLFDIEDIVTTSNLDANVKDKFGDQDIFGDDDD